MASPEPARPMGVDIEMRYCTTSREPDLFGLLHPSRMGSRTPEQEHILKSQWVVVLVTETESDAALYMKPNERPRKSAAEQSKQEAKQESKQVRDRRERRKESTKKGRNSNQRRKEGSGK